MIPSPFGIDQFDHAADGLVLIGGVLVLHVGAPLADVDGSVAIKSKSRGLLDHRFTGNALEMVAGGYLDGFERLGRRERGELGIRIPALFFLLGGDSGQDCAQGD